MDTTKINASLSNSTIGIKIGSDQAPVKMIEFINLRCPYCREWFNDSRTTLDTYVNDEKVQRVIKLFDKTKESLVPGNVMHHYVSQNEPNVLEIISKIYDTQDDWGNLESLDDVATYAEKQLHLTLSEHRETTEQIISEADASGIKFIPTMVVHEHIFDQKISQNDLKELLDDLIEKNT